MERPGAHKQKVVFHNLLSKSIIETFNQEVSRQVILITRRQLIKVVFSFHLPNFFCWLFKAPGQCDHVFLIYLFCASFDSFSPPPAPSTSTIEKVTKQLKNNKQ